MPQTVACVQSDDSSTDKYPRLSGRSKDEVRSEAFLQVTRYLEQNDDEQITINDLANHMRSVIAEENCEPYSFPYMKSQLLKHIGERIIIVEILMAPLQIGLGVQMHHHFQFKFLIESLNSHGLCCSYGEVKRYERCTSKTEHDPPKLWSSELPAICS